MLTSRIHLWPWFFRKSWNFMLMASLSGEVNHATASSLDILINSSQRLLWRIRTEIFWNHYSDVIIDTMASQITSLAIVYSNVYSDSDQKNTSKLRVTGLCVDRWIPRTNGQQRGKCFHLMTSSWIKKKTYFCHLDKFIARVSDLRDFLCQSIACTNADLLSNVSLLTNFKQNTNHIVLWNDSFAIRKTTAILFRPQFDDEYN